MARRTATESAATREAIVDAARRLFAEQGFATVSVPACARAAGVTHGALYHHFPSKADLFAEVFRRVTVELNDAVLAAAMAAPTVRDAFLRGCRESVTYMATPAYQRIALTDAPAVLGWGSWRKMDADIGLPTMVGGLDALRAEGLLDRADDLGALAVLLFGGLTEVAIRVAAGDPTVDVDRTVATIDQLITALSGQISTRTT